MDRSAKSQHIIDQAMIKVAQMEKQITTVASYNQDKMLKAFQLARISQNHFQTSSGYGYGDIAREGLEEIFCHVFKGDSALVRSQISSGTHAIACCLYGLLEPGDTVVSVTGTPYDTLHPVIGHKDPTTGSLCSYGIKYEEVPLLPFDLEPNYEKIASLCKLTKPRVAMIQRSKGYHWRPSFSVKTIGKLVSTIKEVSPETWCFVDNCYGEFVERLEPLEVGADIMAGSMIKNPGGGLATTGGYIVGKEELVERAACRLTAPGIGSKVGATLSDPRLLYQGFFLAPHIVKEALLTAVFTAAIFDNLGLQVAPAPLDKRTDIIQGVRVPTKEMMLAISKGIQEASPVDSFLNPEPSAMAGYANEVLMAGGTFVQGSSIELSADGPMVEPYNLFIQGGLCYEHGKLALEHTLKLLSKQGLI